MKKFTSNEANTECTSRLIIDSRQTNHAHLFFLMLFCYIQCIFYSFTFKFLIFNFSVIKCTEDRTDSSYFFQNLSDIQISELRTSLNDVIFVQLG